MLRRINAQNFVFFFKHFVYFFLLEASFVGKGLWSRHSYYYFFFDGPGCDLIIFFHLPFSMDNNNSNKSDRYFGNIIFKIIFSYQFL